jgi:hypothetical protein
MKKICLFAAMTAALVIPSTILGQDRDHDRDHDKHRYYDKRHRDYHEWNDHEDRAWHMYWEQRHRPPVDWGRASERQRERYWAWRHEHSDAILRIDIR